MKFTVNMFLTYFLYCAPEPYDFLRRRRSFTLRKVYVCLEIFLCFSEKKFYCNFLLRFYLEFTTSDDVQIS